MSTDTNLTPAEFALRTLVAAGHVTQAQVDAALALPGAPAPRKPLTDEQICALAAQCVLVDDYAVSPRGFARIVEAAHGIKS